MSPYTDLDSTKDEFRLIRFVDGHHEVPTLELSTFSMHDDVSWIALSYCWGDKNATEPIVLNKSALKVRPNLYRFLQEMAIENRRNWFFVDAICINQDDKIERAWQVTLMGQIYRKAEEVISWISLEGNTLFLRIGALPSLRHHLRAAQDMEANKTKAENRPVEEVLRDVHSLIDEVKLLVQRNDYWSRLWIVQEVLLAKKLTIRFFSVELDWSEIQFDQSSRLEVDSNGRPLNPSIDTQVRGFGASILRKQKQLGLVKNASIGTHLWRWSQYAGNDLQSGILLDFHEAVHFFALQNCRIAHDKVFGLFGIAKSYIRPSYDMSIIELYASTLYNCLLSHWAKHQKAQARSDQVEPWDLADSHELHSIIVTLSYAFDLDMFQEVVFLVTFEVFQRFLPPREAVSAYMHFAFHWILWSKWSAKRRHVFYEPLRLVGWRVRRSVTRHTKAMADRVYAADKDNLKLKAPGEDAQELYISEWQQMAQSTCNDIWARYQADVTVQESERP